MSTLDELLGGGGTSVKMETIGQSVTGKVLKVSVMQDRDYKTKELATWKDGRPVQKVVVSIQTALRDPSIVGDTGVRSVYVKTWGDNWRAFKAAVAGKDIEHEVGGTFTATLSSFKPSDGGDPEKVYTYTYASPTLTDQVESAITTPVAETPAPATPSPEELAAFAAYLASRE